MNNIIKKTPLMLLSVINILFVIKYGTRFIGSFAYLASAIITIFYLLLVLLIPSVSKKMHKIITPVLIIVIFAGVIFCITIDALVKPENIRVDRWSAIVNWDKKILKGEYPYEARSHLGGVVSGLPGLFFITIPFYFAGDIGYFQAATVLLFSLLCVLLFRKEKALTTIIIYLFSAGFLWEIYVRSDIGGNAVLVILYLAFIERVRKRMSNKNMIFSGMLLGIILTTRTVFIIPVAVYLIRWLDLKKIVSTVLFMISSLATFSLILLPFIIGHFDNFLSNNPFIEQTDKMPVGIAILFIILAIICGYFTKTFEKTILISGYLIFALISCAFIVKIVKVGFVNAFWKSNFDISYFTIVLPFLVLSIFSMDNIDSEGILRRKSAVPAGATQTEKNKDAEKRAEFGINLSTS
jgi:hypothetical protein